MKDRMYGDEDGFLSFKGSSDNIVELFCVLVYELTIPLQEERGISEQDVDFIQNE